MSYYIYNNIFCSVFLKQNKYSFVFKINVSTSFHSNLIKNFEKFKHIYNTFNSKVVPLLVFYYFSVLATYNIWYKLIMTISQISEKIRRNSEN